jgi:hypothetical protein
VFGDTEKTGGFLRHIAPIPKKRWVVYAKPPSPDWRE